METRIHPNVTDGPNEKTTRRRRGRLGCLAQGAIDILVILLVLGIVGGIYQSAASTGDLKRYPAPGKLHDLGGYRLHLYCIGQGSPTVILEAGAANPALAWYFVQGDVAASPASVHMTGLDSVGATRCPRRSPASRWLQRCTNCSAWPAFQVLMSSWVTPREVNTSVPLRGYTHPKSSEWYS